MSDSINSHKQLFSKQEIESALKESFEAGWYGSLELKDFVIAQIIESLFKKDPEPNDKINTYQTLVSTPEHYVIIDDVPNLNQNIYPSNIQISVTNPLTFSHVITHEL